MIPGVTLNLLKSGSTTLTVAQDTATVQSAINSFVQAYNEVNKTIANLTAYNAASKQGGPLLGDSTAQGLQSRIRAMLGQALTGTGSSFTTLSQVGVSFQKDGSLAVDSTKLAAATRQQLRRHTGSVCRARQKQQLAVEPRVLKRQQSGGKLRRQYHGGGGARRRQPPAAPLR